MLGSVLVALILEGVLPGLARVRRPVPVVRFARLRDSRASTDRRAIARRLLCGDTALVPASIVDLRAADTRSSSAATGGAVVFFTVS